LARGVKEKTFDMNAIVGAFYVAEVKYTILRGDKTQQGTIIIGNTKDDFIEMNVTGDCEVYFSCNTKGIISITKDDGEQSEEVIIRFLILV
jgi:hypothetical protein